jgi:hypothetical protein
VTTLQKDILISSSRSLGSWNPLHVPCMVCVVADRPCTLSCRWVRSNPKHLLAQACGYPTRPVKKKARMPDHVEHDERYCWHELEDQDKPMILGEIHSSKPSLEGSAILTDPWTKLWKHIATVHEVTYSSLLDATHSHMQRACPLINLTQHNVGS